MKDQQHRGKGQRVKTGKGAGVKVVNEERKIRGKAAGNGAGRVGVAAAALTRMHGFNVAEQQQAQQAQ